MLCPFCNCENSKVLESRTTAERSSIRRRRECEHCTKRFTTYERVELMPVMVLKKDGSKEDYSSEKIFNSIKRACYKSNVSMAQMEEILESVENDLLNSGKRDITSNTIGKLILDKLKIVEQVAYIRYASYYNQFTKPEDFIEEAHCLIKSLNNIQKTQSH